MTARRCLIYAIVSFLSFNITIILSMLFYSPSSHHVRRRASDSALMLPVADVDDTEEDTKVDSWDDVKKHAEAAVLGAVRPGEQVPGRPPPRRPPNRLVTDYDADVARRVAALAARRARSRDPELISLARDVIDPPPTNNAGYKMFRVTESPQSIEVDRLLQRLEGGFFVECGGLDGERLSNTAFLERQRNWEGLLIEMDPFFYTQLLGKNRQVWSINACLSPYNYFTTLPFAGDTRGRGRLVVDIDDDEDVPVAAEFLRKRKRIMTVPCFPLDTILAALNRSTVDYFSLDIEGFELPVLKTIDWTSADIRVLSVEFNRGKDKTAYKEYMEANGYRTLKELHNGEFFVHDFIFVADKLYKSLRRRQMIEDSKLPVWTRAGAVNRTMIQLQLD